MGVDLEEYDHDSHHCGTGRNSLLTLWNGNAFEKEFDKNPKEDGGGEEQLA